MLGSSIPVTDRIRDEPMSQALLGSRTAPPANCGVALAMYLLDPRSTRTQPGRARQTCQRRPAPFAPVKHLGAPVLPYASLDGCGYAPAHFGAMLNVKPTEHHTLEPVPPLTSVDALRLAIQAMNHVPNFRTGIPNPKRPGHDLRSYELLPMLEAVLREGERRRRLC